MNYRGFDVCVAHTIPPTSFQPKSARPRSEAQKKQTMMRLLHRRDSGCFSSAMAAMETDPPPSPQKRRGVKDEREQAVAAMHWQAIFNGAINHPSHIRQPSASKEVRVHREHRMYETEPFFRPVRPMHLVPALDDRSRATVVNWVIHLGTAIDCTTEIVQLAVTLWDRYMTVVSSVSQPDLVALACLCVAVQQELRTAPEAAASVKVLCRSGGYTLREVRHVMSHVQRVLVKFLESATTAATFSNLYLKVTHADVLTRRVVAFLNECLLADADIQTRFLPSELAATAVLIARRTLDSKYVGASWSVRLAQLSGYREDDLRKCVDQTERVMTAGRVAGASRAGPLTAAVRKYGTTRYLEASKVPLVFSLNK